jgi:hypothetical protein
MQAMITGPPGSAKTTYTFRLFPAWYFANRPDTSLIGASHIQELLDQQRLLREDHQRDEQALGYDLVNDAKGRWQSNNGCNYLARSVRSAFLGFHANMRHRRSYQGQAGADTESAREITWQWFANDLLSRRAPDGWIILIATPFQRTI